MVERSEQLRLPPEARDTVLVLREGIRQKLQRHLPGELPVARAVDPHATRPMEARISYPASPRDGGKSHPSLFLVAEY